MYKLDLLLILMVWIIFFSLPILIPLLESWIIEKKKGNKND